MAVLAVVDESVVNHPGGFYEVPPDKVLMLRHDWANAGWVPGFLTTDQFPAAGKRATISSQETGELILLEPLIDVAVLGFTDFEFSVPMGKPHAKWQAVYVEQDDPMNSGGRTVLVFVEQMDWAIDVTTQGAPEGNPLFGVPDGIVTGADIQYLTNRFFQETQQ